LDSPLQGLTLLLTLKADEFILSSAEGFRMTVLCKRHSERSKESALLPFLLKVRHERLTESLPGAAAARFIRNFPLGIDSGRGHRIGCAPKDGRHHPEFNCN
jgi:hypothetical protein